MVRLTVISDVLIDFYIHACVGFPHPVKGQFHTRTISYKYAQRPCSARSSQWHPRSWTLGTSTCWHQILARPSTASVFVKIVLSSKWRSPGVSLKGYRQNFQERVPGEEKVHQLFNTNCNKWHFHRWSSSILYTSTIGVSQETVVMCNPYLWCLLWIYETRAKEDKTYIWVCVMDFSISVKLFIINR